MSLIKRLLARVWSARSAYECDASGGVRCVASAKFRAGDRARINSPAVQHTHSRTVRLLEFHYFDGWTVEAVGDWNFPDGSRRAIANEKYLKRVWF